MNSTCTALQSVDVSHRISHENLHVTINSQFDMPQAAALINLLEQYHNSCKKIFIDVRQVEKPHPLAAAELKAAFKKGSCTPQQILFKGSCGFDLAVSGNRVLVVSDKKKTGGSLPGMRKSPAEAHEHDHAHEHKAGHVCKGNCPNCRCKHKK